MRKKEFRDSDLRNLVDSGALYSEEENCGGQDLGRCQEFCY